MIKSSPITNGTVDARYFYNMTAKDPDLDTLTFSIESGPSGMSIDANKGKITWNPKTAGNFTVILNVSDGKGGIARQEFVISVSQAVRPQIILVSPQANETLKRVISFSGTVTKGTRDVVWVQVRIDANDWKNAAGNYTWNYRFDTKTLKNGKHAFEFRAYDSKEYSDILKVDFNVNNPASAKSFIPMTDGWMLLALIVIIGIISVAIRK